jgi:hypothetical protein
MVQSGKTREEEQMQFPVLTKSLAYRIQHVLFSLQISGAKAVQQHPDNPLGMHLQQFGSATVYAARAIPGGGWWNRVIGFERETVPLLDEILSFFRTQHLRFYLDMAPTALTEDLARLLVEHGLYPAPNGPFLYGLPQVRNHHLVSEQVVVRETQDIDMFLDLWADGFEFPHNDLTSTLRQLKKGLFTLPENHLYVAYLDGAPAAIGALYIKDGIGHLHAGATLPGFRNRGCHSTLTAHRIAEAAQAQCELITSDTGSLGSKSQNHLEQAGLRIAFTRIMWVGRSL